MNNPITSAKRVFVRSLAFFLLMILSAAGFAQLSTSNVIFSPDTNLTYGDTVSMTYKVKNTGSTPYTGYLNVNYSTDTTAFSLTGFCSIPSVTLTPNGLDSVIGSCTINIDSTHFHPGYNIIVVWSSGNAKTAADTVWGHVYLNLQAGVHDLNVNPAFSIYPSLTKDFINVESTGDIFPLKIFIEDISGRIINVVTPSPENKGKIRINTSELNGDIYFLDMLMPDKRRVVSKFVKTE